MRWLGTILCPLVAVYEDILYCLSKQVDVVHDRGKQPAAPQKFGAFFVRRALEAIWDERRQTETSFMFQFRLFVLLNFT